MIDRYIYQLGAKWRYSVRQVGEATLASRATVLDVRQQEAREDKEGKGTDGAMSPDETYSVNREWISEEYRKANEDLKGGRGEQDP